MTAAPEQDVTNFEQRLEEALQELEVVFDMIREEYEDEGRALPVRR